MTGNASMSVVPDHVPAACVYNFDIYSPAAGCRDMIESAALASTRHPSFFYTPLNGGHWVFTGYDLVNDGTKDTTTYSSKPYTIPQFAEEPDLFPLLLDPPRHGPYRSVLQKIFTARAAATLQDEIRSAASELADAVKGQGACDFVASFSELLPISVFLKLMGLPIERLAEYRHAAKTYLGKADIEAKTVIGQWIATELSAAIAEREKEPRDDVISEMLASGLPDRQLIFDEVLNLAMMIFLAGLDTVTVSMSYGMRHLAEDQALQHWARKNPNRIQDLAEELLRRYSAAQPGRTATCDVTVGDVTIRKGDRVFFMIAAANLDARMFDDPLTVSLERPRKPHLAFSNGPHRCVGMHLARIELQVGYTEWLSRIPQFRVDAAQPQEYHGGHVFSMGNLQLEWH